MKITLTESGVTTLRVLYINHSAVSSSLRAEKVLSVFNAAFVRTHAARYPFAVGRFAAAGVGSVR